MGRRIGENQGLMRAPAVTAVLAGLVLLLGAQPAAAQGDPRATLQQQLDALVAADGGPPGAVVTLRRGSRTTVLTSGVADVASGRRPRATDHMRIASVAKTFNGAVVLRLVAQGRLRLGSTIGEVLPRLPRTWRGVTVRQLMNHTSGVPDYTRSDGFREQFQTDPDGVVRPAKVIGWVRRDPLVFRPGSRYAYSNTDNIVLGLMAEEVTGRSYAGLLRRFVFRPLGLRKTSLPLRTGLPRPFLHGYVTEPGSPPEDVSTLLSPSGAWASGGIVSTPLELGRFIRGLLGSRLFPRAVQRRQLRFVAGGQSSPPGPGRNSAGLSIFRYRTAAARSTGTRATSPATSSSRPPRATGGGASRPRSTSRPRRATCSRSCARCRRPPCACSCGSAAAPRRGHATAARLHGVPQVLIRPCGLNTNFLAAPWSKSL
jgi:D-alanyl-D-alanine carboxypeptidase